MYLYLYYSHDSVKEHLLMEVLSSAHSRTKGFILGCHLTRARALTLLLINLSMKQSCVLDRLPDSSERRELMTKGCDN